MIEMSNTGHIITGNTKHIKATPLTVEQYHRDQINKNTADCMNEILKNYGKLVQENVSNNHDRKEGGIHV